MRLYRNRQGLTKGKKKNAKPAKAPRDHRTRPQLAVELIRLAAAWFPNDSIVVTGDSAMAVRACCRTCPTTCISSATSIPKALCMRATAADQGPQGVTQKGERLPGMAAWADDPKKPWTELSFDQFGLHAKLAVKTQQALYYKAGGSRLLTIILTRDLQGGRPDQMFYCTHLAWDVRQILSTYACRWAIRCTFENCKQFLGLEDPANRLPLAVARTALMALFLYGILITWFHRVGHAWVQFQAHDREYPSKREPSFADVLTTLRRVSCAEKTEHLVPKRCRLKTWLTQLTEFFSRGGITAAVSRFPHINRIRDSR